VEHEILFPMSNIRIVCYQNWHKFILLFPTYERNLSVIN